jgi:hypothetical protein
MELTNVFSDRARESPYLPTADNQLSAVGKTLKVVGSAWVSSASLAREFRNGNGGRVIFESRSGKGWVTL